MNTKILMAALFIGTASIIAAKPAIEHHVLNHTATTAPTTNSTLTTAALTAAQQATIEIVFVLDTTGSMGGLINAAKEKIWSIASSMASAKPAPRIKIGLVAFRDKGDTYVTKTIDLSDDLDSIYAHLIDFRADGGGDTPESVNQALDDAVNKVSWSESDNTYKVVFLIGDAPPQMHYKDDTPYTTTLAVAAQKGIIINTIQCGQDPETRQQWQRIARLNQGQFFQVAAQGDGVAISTPFDDDIAALSKSLDDTRLFYGSRQQRSDSAQKKIAADKLHQSTSAQSRARRAVFNLSASGKKNLLGEKELVEAITTGKASLETLDTDQLPEPIAALPASKRKEAVNHIAAKRTAITGKLQQLTQKRDHYIKDTLKNKPAATKSLDDQIYNTLRAQAKKHWGETTFEPTAHY